MKKFSYPFFVLCFSLLISFVSNAQDEKTKLLKDLPKTFMTTQKLPKTKEDNERLFDNRVLNVFFTNRVSNYMSASSDISFSKGYALLDNEDGRLFIGGTWNTRRSDAAKTRYLLTTGVKSNIKEQFASFYEGGKVQNDIGLSLKFTVVGKGKIDIGKASKGNLEKIRVRREMMVAEYDQKISDGISNYERALQSAFSERNTDKAEAQSIHQKAYSELHDEYATKLYKTVEVEMAMEEAEYVYDEGLFSHACDHWLGVEIYAPLTYSSYVIADSLRMAQSHEVTYSPFAMSLTYTGILEFSKFGKFMLQAGGGMAQNNSVKSEEIEKYSYDQYLAQSIKDTLSGTTFPDTLFMASLKKDDVYVGKFDQWLGPQLRGKFVYMPLSFIGISVAGELNFRNGHSDYFKQNQNWTIGIPVSLNDKDGVRLVNFEVQWREVSQQHSIGISVNYVFGKPDF